MRVFRWIGKLNYTELKFEVKRGRLSNFRKKFAYFPNSVFLGGCENLNFLNFTYHFFPRIDSSAITSSRLLGNDSNLFWDKFGNRLAQTS